MRANRKLQQWARKPVPEVLSKLHGQPAAGRVWNARGSKDAGHRRIFRGCTEM